jgi:hypothetical protein
MKTNRAGKLEYFGMVNVLSEAYMWPRRGNELRNLKKGRMKLFPLSICLFLAALVSAMGASFDHSHGKLETVLKKHVAGGLVDYAGLKVDSAGLNSYLDDLATVAEADFRSWTEPQQLAYLINLYNAATLKLIVDNYPLTSIKKVGNFLKGPWKQPVVRLHGKMTDLDSIEHKILRQDYQEPRIHFALVCAALGCPPLRAEAFTAEKLDAQLEDQGRRFLNDTTKNSVDVKKHVLYLSPIFKWFSDDFARKGKTVPQFVTPYFAEPAASELKQGDFRIAYTDYDWSLNDRKQKPAQ